MSAADEEKVKSKMREILAEMYGIAPVRIGEATTMDGLGLDSLDMAEFGYALEEEYGISLDSDDVYEARTLGEYARGVCAAINAKNNDERKTERKTKK